jgi:hypothetical protein
LHFLVFQFTRFDPETFDLGQTFGGMSLTGAGVLLGDFTVYQRSAGIFVLCRRETTTAGSASGAVNS